jgi:hypothetical protein
VLEIHQYIDRASTIPLIGGFRSWMTIRRHGLPFLLTGSNAAIPRLSKVLAQEFLNYAWILGQAIEFILEGTASDL